MKKTLIFLGVFMALSTTVFAHNPRVILFGNPSLENPVVIENPDVSQAFYGELNGQPEYYKFSLKESTPSLVGILAPIMETNFVSVDLIDENNMTITSLKEDDYDKGTFFEEFGGDYYINGPEVKQVLPPGEYTLKVFNKTNIGKYSLVVGETESFPLLESLKTIVILPILKEGFFEKPVLEFFGTFLAIGILLLSLVYRRSGKKYKGKFITGVVFLVISTIAIIIRNPLEIMGMLRALFLLIALVLHSIGLYKARLGKTMYRVILAFWIIVLFLTATI